MMRHVASKTPNKSNQFWSLRYVTHVDVRWRAVCEWTFTMLHVFPINQSKFVFHKRLKIGPAFYPPSVNSAFRFIARLRTRRSANRTQPNFETFWEVNQVCKCMLNIWLVHRREHCRAKTTYLWVWRSTNCDRWRKIGQEFYPPSLNACHDYSASRIGWCCIANVSGTIEIKLLLLRGPKIFS